MRKLNWWHFQCWMDPCVVVLPNSLVNSEYKFSDIFKSRPVTKINLELWVEGFLVAILPWTPRSRPRYFHTNSFECFNENLGVVFTSIIAVVDLWSSICEDSIHECRERELYCVCGVDRQTNNFSRVLGSLDIWPWYSWSFWTSCLVVGMPWYQRDSSLGGSFSCSCEDVLQPCGVHMTDVHAVHPQSDIWGASLCRVSWGGSRRYLDTLQALWPEELWVYHWCRSLLFLGLGQL